MTYITVTPAYDRDYKSGKAVKEDWNAGKDFVICDMFHKDNGRYINKDDAPSGSTINIRYKNLTQVLPIKIK